MQVRAIYSASEALEWGRVESRKQEGDPVTSALESRTILNSAAVSSVAITRTEYGPFLTGPEFEKLVGVAPNTAGRWRKSKTGPRAFKVGRRWRYKTDEVLQFLEGNLK